MNESLGALQAVQAIGVTSPAGAAPMTLEAATDPAPFAPWFAQQIESLNAQMVQSEVSVQQLAAGETSNLHEVMIRLEESKLAFQFAVQVRNRVVEAYQDVLRLQV